MNNMYETITLRDLLEKSNRNGFAVIQPHNTRSFTVTIPKAVETSAAQGLLDDRDKLLAWFGVDKDNIVSNYELSVNSQDITNGRLKNTKHFLKTCRSWWNEAEIEFCGIMYLQPHDRAEYSTDDWWHLIDILQKHGISYGFAAIGEISSDGSSVKTIKYYFQDFMGTIYTTSLSDDQNAEHKIFYYNRVLTEKIKERALAL